MVHVVALNSTRSKHDMRQRMKNENERKKKEVCETTKLKITQKKMRTPLNKTVKWGWVRGVRQGKKKANQKPPITKHKKHHQTQHNSYDCRPTPYGTYV